MAELKLRVSLDTSYLKGQISRLPLEFAGANVSIRPKFDRQTIVNEFRLLNRYIGSKKFNIVINTNLNKEIENADRLVKALGRVQQAASGAKGGLPIGTQVLSRTKSKGGFAAAEIKTLFGAAVQGGLIDEKTLAATRAQMVAALGSIGRDSIAGLLNGLKSGDADIQNAAKFLGNNLITSFKTVLGIASPSREFKKIGESAGQGFEQGLLKSIEIAEQSATRKMQRMLDRLARMALMMGGMSGPEIGRQVAQARGLPALNFGATTPRASVGIGPSSSGRMLSAAPSRTAIAGAPAPAGLLPSLSSAGQSKAIIEALIASTGPRLLPSGGGDDSLGKLAAPRQTKDAVDAILRNYFKVVEAQVKEVFSAPPIKKESLNIFDHLDTEQYFNYLAQARVNAENAIKQRIEEAKQVTKQNQIKDAAQSFLRALEETVRNAERSAFTQSRIAANRSYVQRANIREIGQPLLGGRQGAAPKMLSAATGFYRGAATPPPLPETQAQLFARREREARMRSVLRGVDVMGETSTRAPARYSYAHRPAMPRRPTSAIVPYESGGALVPSGGGGRGPGGGGLVPPGGFPSDDVMVTRNAKLGTVMDVAAASTRNFTASQIPLIGGLKSLAGEIGQATKQVLLYGTAYKGLAFLTSLPGQILNAAKSQQQFNNALTVATQDTGTFAKELLYVDNVQRAFGLNLETTRTGFTRLYASMAPTGFDSGSIEKLFTGISAATASLQLSPDQAGRVTYAFAQIASKGQIMAEEVKGQLGDVLPGALAIFAKSAGMSVGQFNKAMENGEFVGERFREVFAKVSDELINRFGTGAQAAGRSLQGLINTVGGDFTRTLQSFAPLANAAAQATLGPLTGMLREVSMAAQIAMGEQDRVKKQLEAAQTDVSMLKEGGADAKDIKAAETNVAALAAQYEVLNEAAKDPAIAQQVKNIEAFVAEIQKAATVTMNLAGVIGSVLNPLFTFLGGNITSVIGNLALLALGFNAAKMVALLLTGTLATLNAIQQANGSISVIAAAKGTILAGVYRLLGVQATGAQVATIGFGVAIKGLLIATGIGAVIVLLGSLAAAFLSVGNKAKEAADRAKRSIDSMADAARTGNVSLIEMELAVNKADRQDVENLIKKVEGLQGKRKNVAGGKSVEMVTLPPELKREAKRLGIEVAGEVTKGSILGSLGELRKPLQDAAASGEEDLVAARKRAETLGTNKPDPATATADTQPEEDKKKTSLESYYGLQDTLAKNAADFAAAQTEEEFRHKIELLEMYYDIQETRANAYQKDAIRFEREMVMIEAKRQEARLKAQLDVQRAQSSVAGGAGSSASGTGAIFGDTGRTFNAAGFVHGHFQNQDREALVKDTVEVVMGLLSKGVSPELGSGARFTSGMNAKQVEALVRQGIGSHKQYASGVGAVDIFMPKGTQVPVPVSGIQNLGGAAGVTGSLPRGSQLMHLDPASTMSAAAGGTVPGKVTPSAKRDAVAEQNTLQASIAKTNKERMADARAAQEQIVVLEKYRAVAFPTIEQETQNKLLAKRNELFRSGMTDEQIDKEIKLYENQERGTAALATVQRLYDGNIIKLDKYNELMAIFNNDIATQNTLLKQNADYLAQQKFDLAIKGVRDQLAMARSFTPEQEMRTQIAQEGFTGAEAESVFQERKTLESAQKLKSDMQGIAGAIGDSFGEAFKGIITGSMTAQEALAGFFQSVANYFADMVAKMIAEYLKMAIIKGIMSLIGGVAGGLGGGGANLGPNSSAVFGLNSADMMQYSSLPTGYANGGVLSGGFQAFANGGIVTGPTLGLVGEGRYNEAVIPLPDGKSVPVQLSGGDGGNQINSNITVNVSNGQAQSNATGSNSSELGRKIEGAVKQVIVGELRPGGLLAR